MGLLPVWRPHRHGQADFKMLNAFVCPGLKIIWADSRRLDKTCERKGLLKVFDHIKDGGKSNMGEKAIIGCVEQLGPRVPVIHQMNGSSDV